MPFRSAKLIQDAAVARPTGKPNRGAQDTVTFATSTVNVTGRSPAKYFTISIGGNVAAQAGFKAGDLVGLGLGEEEDIGAASIFHVDDHKDGWILSGSKENKSGQQVLKLRFVWHKGLPFLDGKKECTEIQAKPGDLQFRFPEGTVFDTEKQEQPESDQDLRTNDSPRRSGDDRREIKFGRRSADRLIIDIKATTNCHDRRNP